jgi:16S rRNA (cytosine1402-N4)-methyltransferase
VNSEFIHETVLRHETVGALLPSAELLSELGDTPYTIVDCTLGGGGHSLALLQLLSSQVFTNRVRLIGIDRDELALSAAKEKLLLARHDNVTIEFIHNSFADGVATLPPHSVHALCADFGVSSPQIDIANRGFSLRHDGPLDMRMNIQQERTARNFLETESERELFRIFRDYGEEPRAKKLASAVIEDRNKGTLPLDSTLGFAAWTERVLCYRGSRVHPATRIFQALRIAVNDELGQIKTLLNLVPTLLSSHGRAAFISFHSLEDRLVKHEMRKWERGGREDDQPPNFPHLERQTWGRETPRGGVVSSAEELRNNPRAHSARLRVFCFGGQIRSE